MLDAQPYDTFDDCGDCIPSACSARELIDLTLGPHMEQPIAGVVVSGDYSSRDTLGWGGSRRIGSNVVYLRSAPRHRFGKPLHGDETRLIATLCFSLKTGGATISVAKLYLPVELAPTSDLARDICAPLTMPFMPLLIFSDHIAPKPGCIAVRSAHGHKLVIPSSVVLVEPDGSTRIETGHNQSQLATALVGLRLCDTVLKPVQCMNVHEWTRVYAQTLARIEETTCVSSTRGFTTRGVMDTAASICEAVSASGLVDLLSTPALAGAIPDALERPGSILCIIAAMTRMAAYPGMVGLEAGTPSEAWAATELASCFEANYSVIAHSSEDRFMAIDMALRVSFHNASRTGNADIHSDSINYLFQCGLALCVDCFGPASTERARSEYGQSKTGDCVRHAHLDKAYAKGVCAGHTPVHAARLNSRAEHQTTLLRILDRVELFLRNDPEDKLDCDRAVTPVVFGDGTHSENQYHSLLNLDAMKTVISVLQRVQTRGSMCFELEKIHVYPVSREMHIECAGCPRLVSVLEACMFSTRILRCCACLRPCCSECGSDHEVQCLRCSHGASSA